MTGVRPLAREGLHFGSAIVIFKSNFHLWAVLEGNWVLLESLDSQQVITNGVLVCPVWLIATKGPFFTGLASGQRQSRRCGCKRAGGIDSQTGGDI
jgi:hypothetical protein